MSPTSGKHLNTAILLLVAGNFMAIIADVIVKIMGSEAPIFQHMFVRTLVTSAEYTGLIWAALIGWIWFAEVPDLWFIAGSAMIVIPLVLLSLRQNRQRGRLNKTPA